MDGLEVHRSSGCLDWSLHFSAGERAGSPSSGKPFPVAVRLTGLAQPPLPAPVPGPDPARAGEDCWLTVDFFAAAKGALRCGEQARLLARVFMDRSALVRGAIVSDASRSPFDIRPPSTAWPQNKQASMADKEGEIPPCWQTLLYGNRFVHALPKSCTTWVRRQKSDLVGPST